jgi:hypothetical protein
MKRFRSCLHSAAACLVLVPLMTGCSDGVAADGYMNDLPALETIEELRIGSVDDPDVGFSQIGGVATGKDGLLYVLERVEREIRAYDEGGALVRRFGRGGSGPGEFELPLQLGVVGDTVWVNDMRLQRLNLFNTDGTYISSYSPAPVQLELAPGIHVMLRAGSLASDGTLIGTWGVAVPREPPTDTVQIPIVRMDTTGAILDTIRLEQWAFPQRRTVTVAGRPNMVPAAPSTFPLHADAPDGGAFVVERPLAADSETGAFRVHRLDAAGDTVSQRSYRYRPLPWNDAAIDSVVARHVSTLRMEVDAGVAAAEIRRAIAMPAFQPGITAARAGSDGSLWMLMQDAASDAARWILIDADGVARGAITLPRRATLRPVNADVIWVEEPDEMDVP